MFFNMSLTTRNGKQYFGHTMTDILANDVLNNQGCQEDSYHRINQIKPVHLGHIKAICQHMLDSLYQRFQQPRSDCRHHSHQEGHKNEQLALTKMLLQPSYKNFGNSLIVLFIFYRPQYSLLEFFTTLWSDYFDFTMSSQLNHS